MDSSYIGSGVMIEKAIKKYGSCNFTCEILGWASTKEELDKLEIFFIDLYNAVESHDFYNIHGGGTDGDNYTGRSEDNKKNFRKRYLGSSNPFYGKSWDEEHMKRFREASTGSNNAMYGKPVTGDRLDKIQKRIVELQGRPIVQLSLSGEFIQEFDYIRQPHNLFPDKYGDNGIGECCRHNQSTAYGYKWMYKSEYEQMKEN
jgi:group I intron endonuclease